MKLKNKETGEIYELYEFCLYDDKGFAMRPFLKSLAELNAEWEDVPEEPKGSALDLMILTLTNFIENEPDEDKVDLEDCKRMLDKLKAWKRLEDKGFKTEGWTIDDGLRVSICTNLNSDGIYDEDRKETKKDLDICFGGEE